MATKLLCSPGGRVGTQIRITKAGVYRRGNVARSKCKMVFCHSLPEFP